MVKFIFSPTGCFGVVFWICAGLRGYNTEIFFVIAEHRAKTFSGFHSATLAGIGGELEIGRGHRTGDPKGP